MAKILKVSSQVFTRKGEAYQEFKVDGVGRYILEDGKKKHPHQITKEDSPTSEDRLLGDLINYALDIQDDKLTSKERRLRFALSQKIQGAMKRKETILMDREDEKRIEEATEKVQSNFFVSTILESLEEAESYKQVVNGKSKDEALSEASPS